MCCATEIKRSIITQISTVFFTPYLISTKIDLTCIPFISTKLYKNRNQFIEHYSVPIFKQIQASVTQKLMIQIIKRRFQFFWHTTHSIQKIPIKSFSCQLPYNPVYICMHMHTSMHDKNCFILKTSLFIFFCHRKKTTETFSQTEDLSM